MKMSALQAEDPVRRDLPAAAAPPQDVDGNQFRPLELFDVHKTWRKTNNPVLRGVDLTLEPGSITWIAGRNGVGKTTLLRVAAGLIGCEKGVVTAFGLTPHGNRREFQRRVGFLSAGNVGLYARLSVRIQIDTWARIGFVGRRDRAGRVERVLEEFDLLDLAESRCDRISTGQRQRVRLAMAFVTDPEVVLLDEPGTSLDVEGQELLAEAIQRTADRGGAAMWISPTGDHPGVEFTDSFLLENGKLRPL